MIASINAGLGKLFSVYYRSKGQEEPLLEEEADQLLQKTCQNSPLTLMTLKLDKDNGRDIRKDSNLR